MSCSSFSRNADGAEDICNAHFDHQLYGLKPEHRMINQMPVVNDILPHQLINGKITKVNNVTCFTENGAVFIGDPQVHELDAVIYGTGYLPRFPFLDGVMDFNSEADSVYKLVFPVSLPKNTLAFVGNIDTNLLTICCVAEIQSRWVAQVFSGKVQLPSRKYMELDNEKRVKDLVEVFGENHNCTLFVNSFPYAEDIASKIGVKPSMFWLSVTDPRLFWACLTGPVLPCQYRLFGPHSWSGAREEILGFHDYLMKHLRREELKKSKFRFKTAAVLFFFSIGSLIYFKKCPLKFSLRSLTLKL